jgi:hypothetical protein
MVTNVGIGPWILDTLEIEGVTKTRM